MDRKDFLKVCGAVAGGMTAGPLLGRVPVTGGRTSSKNLGLWQFYGTGDGKIFSRQRVEDAWALHADFGSDYGISSIYRKGTDVLADVESKDGKFTLRLSADGRYWIAVGR